MKVLMVKMLSELIFIPSRLKSKTAGVSTKKKVVRTRKYFAIESDFFSCCGNICKRVVGVMMKNTRDPMIDFGIETPVVVSRKRLPRNKGRAIAFMRMKSIFMVF